MAVITLSETKALLQISDTSKDALITTLIPLVESAISDHTNQLWTDDPGVPAWKAWMKLPASEMIGYRLSVTSGSTNGMKSESQGGYSYTKADLAGGYPVGIMSQFDCVRMARVGTPSKKENYRDTRGWTAQELVTHEPAQGVQDADYEE